MVPQLTRKQEMAQPLGSFSGMCQQRGGTVAADPATMTRVCNGMKGDAVCALAGKLYDPTADGCLAGSIAGNFSQYCIGRGGHPKPLPASHSRQCLLPDGGALDARQFCAQKRAAYNEAIDGCHASKPVGSFSAGCYGQGGFIEDSASGPVCSGISSSFWCPAAAGFKYDYASDICTHP